MRPSDFSFVPALNRRSQLYKTQLMLLLVQSLPAPVFPSEALSMKEQVRVKCHKASKPGSQRTQTGARNLNLSYTELNNLKLVRGDSHQGASVELESC